MDICHLILQEKLLLYLLTQIPEVIFERQLAEEQFNQSARAEIKRPEEEQQQEIVLGKAIEDNRRSFTTLTETVDKARIALERVTNTISDKLSGLFDYFVDPKTVGVGSTAEGIIVSSFCFISTKRFSFRFRY
jgi:hypothetical protein